MAIFNRKAKPNLSGHLENGERVLAWTSHSGGDLVVTNFALLSFDHHENLRLPWELVLSAKWDEPILIVNAQDTAGDKVNSRAWNLTEPGLVPDSVRERITTSQVFDQLKEIPGVGKVRFLARKGKSGITWATLAETPVDSNSQTHIDQELESLRQNLGI